MGIMKLRKWILLDTEQQWLWRYIMGAMFGVMLIALFACSALILCYPENFQPDEIAATRKNFPIALKWIVGIYIGGDILMGSIFALMERITDNRLR
jgi:hypothetical protein